MNSTPFASSSLARLLDVRHAEREPRLVRLELQAVRLRVPEAQRHVRRLDLALRVLADREPEHVVIPGDGTLDVSRRHGDEIDLLDLQRTPR